jgi:hypothetical protein
VFGNAPLGVVSLSPGYRQLAEQELDLSLAPSHDLAHLVPVDHRRQLRSIVMGRGPVVRQ